MSIQTFDSNPWYLNNHFTNANKSMTLLQVLCPTESTEPNQFYNTKTGILTNHALLRNGKRVHFGTGDAGRPERP